MYHPKNLVHTACLALLLALYLNQIFMTTACLAGQTASGIPSLQQASVESTSYQLVPSRRDCRNKPSKITLYESDTTPLGDRRPFLLVHGLRGEYYHGFRWDALVNHFQANEQFSKTYKIYLARYDSLAPLSETVPLMKGTIADLYGSASKRPLTVMALSIGGNLVYEAMLDRDTDSRVDYLFTLGTPFRGSPLFCADWFKYSLYKNFSLPLTRIDHAVAYRLYFGRNPNLLKDYGWDNCDKSIPDVGRFASLLPFGPRGNLIAENAENKQLSNLPDKNFDKKKLVTYSGYLLNPFLLPKGKRLIASVLLAPYDFCTIELMAHLGKEEPVLKMLDRQIAGIRPNASAAQRANCRFVYALNDGITPLASALFLPAKVVASQPLAKESDIAKIKDSTDVGRARVFRNIDHLAFIGGARPSKRAKFKPLPDELNPDTKSLGIFDWMLSDIAQHDADKSRLARQDTANKTTPAD